VASAAEPGSVWPPGWTTRPAKPDHGEDPAFLYLARVGGWQPTGYMIRSVGRSAAPRWCSPAQSSGAPPAHRPRYVPRLSRPGWVAAVYAGDHRSGAGVARSAGGAAGGGAVGEVAGGALSIMVPMLNSKADVPSWLGCCRQEGRGTVGGHRNWSPLGRRAIRAAAW
jgi:hypothetical protein